MYVKVEYFGNERNVEDPQSIEIVGHSFNPSNGWVICITSEEWETLKKESSDLRLVESDGTEPVPLDV